MDSLHGADITNSAVAGSIETIGVNSADNNVRGGHSVHTASGNAASTVSNNSLIQGRGEDPICNDNITNIACKLK